MSSEELQLVKVSRPGPEESGQARTVLKDLSGLKRFSRKRLTVVELPDGQRLGLALSRKWLRARCWVIRFNKTQTTCPACRQKAQVLSYTISKGLFGADAQLAEWLGKLSQEHLMHRESHDEPSSVRQDEPAGGPIKVQMTSETGQTRIKLLNTESEGSPTAAPPLAPQGARIKVNDGGASVGSGVTKVEVKSPEEARQRIHEPVSGPPRIIYGPSSKSIVDVTFSAHICKHLIQHCGLSLQHGREVGGVLYGYKKEERTAGPDGKLLYTIIVSDLIQFRAADSSGSRLHLNTDSWAYVGQAETDAGLDEQNKIRLGWYHTHPTQGIFFSKYDYDFHTVFSSAYQFAIVIDPRNMEAGLFYWDDYERRSLIRSNNFMLSRGGEAWREAGGPAEVSHDEGAPARQARSDLTLRRVFSFVLPALAAPLIMLMNEPAYGLGPDQMCVLALIAVLGLSLWNADWFHPKDPAEVKLLTRLQQFIYDAGSRVDRMAVGRPNSAPRRSLYKWVVFGLSLVLAIGALLKYGAPQRWLRQGRGAAPAVRPANPAVTNSVDATSSAPITIAIDVFRERTLTLKYGKDADAVKVEYSRDQNGYWTPVQPAAEQQFFRRAFQWDVQAGQARPYIRALQESLGAGAGQWRGQPDGAWGPRTRQQFLAKAEQLAASESTFDVPLPDGGPARVRFIKAGP